MNFAASRCHHRSLLGPTWLRFGWVVLCALVAPYRAWAADITTVASSFEPDQRFDARLSLSLRRSLFSGAITREAVGRAVGQTAVQWLKELRYHHSETVLSPRLELGLWRNLQLHIELPITVAASRSYSFDQTSGDGCGDPPTTNCITRDNSTLVRDGFLDASQMSANQKRVGSSQGEPGGLVLPTRSGLDQLYLGLSWAPLDQRKDPTKPSWVVGFESRLAVGSPMQYGGSTNPSANTSVGKGVHQLHFWTSVSRRFRYVDPWLSLYYLLPLATKGSLYHQTSFALSGQKRAGPQHIGGAELGMEIIAWERPVQRKRFGIELTTRVTGIFEGRGYSPVWELFANSPRLAGPCHTDPASFDPSLAPPWYNGSYCNNASDTLPYPGITNIENYLNFTGVLALTAQWTKHLRARLGVSFGHDTSHYITFATAGRARNRNQQIDRTNPLQVNPLYRDLIDGPGNRFRVQGASLFDLLFAIEGAF